MSEEIELSFDPDTGKTAVMQSVPSIDAGTMNVKGEANPFTARQADDEEAASVGDEDEDHTFPVADEHGQPAHYPGEEENVNHRGLDGSEKKKAPRSVIAAGVESFKYMYSCTLLIFAVAVVMAAVFSKQTVGTADRGIPPIAAFFIFWFLICWLGMMEGGQGCLVGLQPINKALYAESHPRSLKNTELAHRGDNMERFIVGRQFLVVLVVFLANLMSFAVEGASVLGLSTVMNDIFLASGLSVILITIMIGQLTAQVNAANCMLDFVNNYFMLFTVTYVSLFIEFIGILHSVYLVQIFFAKVTGKSIESTEPPRSGVQIIFFWGRVLMSLALLGFSFAVTLKALFDGNTTMWASVPPAASVVIFFLLMCFVGMMEGMQIALFAVVNLPEEELQNYTIAYKNCQLTFTGQNLQAFLIGRQIFVTVCMFVVARITTLDIGEDDPNIFGVSDGVQEFFNTGLLGALITTIVASLAWRIIASSFPLAFLSNPLIYLIIRLCLALEASGVCSAAWVLGRWNKLLAGFQPDEVYLEGAERHTADPVTRRDKDIDRCITVFKFVYSSALLVFCVIVVMAAIFSKQTVGTADRGIHPALAFFIFWFLICWLGMMEGGQGCLVGLQPVDKGLYAESHPRSLKNTRLAHKGDNMERFIVGRQFLVVLVVFVINLMAFAVEDASVLGLSPVMNEIFLATGLATILTTIMIGQLTAQVNGAKCMLDFINNYFMLFTTYVSLFIEFIGILHSVYLVQIFFSKITGKPIETNEPPRSGVQKAFFWGRVLVSLVLLGFSFAVTLKALFDGNTTMWASVPPAASVVIFFLLMCFVGMMEGMQIALFAVVNMPEEELQNHTIAYANCQLTFKDQNLQAFLIGRQIFVTVCMFVVARITTLDIPEGEPNIFGVSDGLQEFFNTGLLGALITTIVASLAWRIIASSFPLAFLSNPLIYLIIRLCLALEASGVCSAAWVLGRWSKLLVGFQPDEIYLEGAERHGRKPVTRRDKDIDITVTVVKYLYSSALLIFCVVVFMAAIFSNQTKFSENTHAALAFIVFWFMMIWLGMMEGGQGCLVGLQPVERGLYAESHPKSLKNTRLAHKGDNMERFIVGRQFLVVLVIFITNMCGFAIKGASVLGLSDVMTDIFLGSGLAVILTTIMIGQLTAQVNAANCMLDFVNNYFMLFTVTYVSLFIEFIGILHSVYLVQIFFSKITGKPIETNEPPRSGVQKAFFWGRVLMSLALLGFSFAVTLKALFDGKTLMWASIPAAASVVIFLLLMCFVGMMEGMQIALFAVINISEEELKHHRIAFANCQLTFTGKNLQAFLIGRQICVTVCMFVIARITTLDIGEDDPNIFGVSDGVQEFFNTGLLGAVITTIVASLAWRIIASSFPLAFLSNPLIYLIIRLCLVLEASGLCSAAWLMALIHKQLVGYQPDEVYIGTVEEREAAKKDQELALEEEPMEAGAPPTSSR